MLEEIISIFNQFERENFFCSLRLYTRGNCCPRSFLCAGLLTPLLCVIHVFRLYSDVYLLRALRNDNFHESDIQRTSRYRISKFSYVYTGWFFKHDHPLFRSYLKFRVAEYSGSHISQGTNCFSILQLKTLYVYTSL